MRSRTILRLSVLLLLAFALGCESKNVGKLEGTNWRSEPTTFKGKKVPEGFLRLKFAQDGSMTYIAGPLTFHGKYSLGMGNYVTFHLDKPLAGRNDHTESIEVRLGQMTVVDSDGTTVHFRKY